MRGRRRGRTTFSCDQCLQKNVEGEARYTTVTIEWRPGESGAGAAASKAYELQWRLRGDGKAQAGAWESASQLILNTTCRKRNLRRRSCYEFRVRAASVSGWSPHSDPLVITTLAEAPGDAAPARPATSQAPSRGNGAQRDRRSAGELPAVGRRPAQGRGPWQCSVCKRSNGPGAAKCSVCGTKKDYDWAPAAGKGAADAAPRVRRASKPSDDDDDWGLDGDTWTFSERDVPSRPARESDVDYGDDASTAGGPAYAARPTFWLNTAATCLHNVRREPIKGSPIVGHLVADTEVEVLAEAGNWIKCKYHRPYKSPDGAPQPRRPDKEGWCLKWDDASGAVYVVDDGNAYPSSGGDEGADDEVIYELRDEDNRLYYFNCYTGVSMWEPPEWTDSVDPASGAVYYTHSETGETQWERPFDFVPIVREELYSTPQARFIKSILSPKRSHHNMNHAMPGVGLPRV